MNINQLKIKLKELQTNLQNKRVQEALNDGELSLEDFEKSLQLYHKNIEQIQDDDLLKTIETKILELISYSNNPSFSSFYHQFINAANFLISNTPKELNAEENNISGTIQISEEEFSRRYDKLIEALNFEGEECNLILETPSEKKPFKIYKTKTKSLAIYAETSEKPMSIGADRLLEVAFKRREPTYKSYESVLISKIINNSIFDFFTTTKPTNLIEAIKNKLSNNEDDLLILKNEFEKIKKDNEELENKKLEFEQILTKSETARQEYILATEAAVDYAKLNASVSYWETKQKSHKTKFWWFGGAAIGFIVILLFILFKTLNYHNNQINVSKKIENISDTNITSESNKAIQDINKSISAPNHEENSKPFNFDYSKLAWYIFIIFASSSAFWIIRIIVKIALSNLHLSEDANERVVMIQTYLSFVKEGQIDENDKNLILYSLFRPSNIGIIKDESSVTVADIITAFKK